MGKLIVFEGTDGSGKSTQFSLLTKRLQAMQVDFRTMVFPQYSEPSSALIRMYLGGEFGTRPSDVNAYAASTFYAVDRYASYRKVWREYYQNGGLMLSDRYTTSNAVHQASKEPDETREEFFRWLYDFEYHHMELPEPDIVIYLDVPTELTGQMLRRREHALLHLTVIICKGSLHGFPNFTEMLGEFRLETHAYSHEILPYQHLSVCTCTGSYSDCYHVHLGGD